MYLMRTARGSPCRRRPDRRRSPGSTNTAEALDRPGPTPLKLRACPSQRPPGRCPAPLQNGKETAAARRSLPNCLFGRSPRKIKNFRHQNAGAAGRRGPRFEVCGLYLLQTRRSSRRRAPSLLSRSRGLLSRRVGLGVGRSAAPWPRPRTHLMLVSLYLFLLKHQPSTRLIIEHRARRRRRRRPRHPHRTPSSLNSSPAPGAISSLTRRLRNRASGAAHI
mmetsp:Transcript_2857/g.8315  ORF Transcript_2857/g.8315 Transcript_2857/m.8315 type:complete len:220 (-) Transcript_2857:294-953(-)